MANAVNYLSQIQTGQTIQAVHVNQFVDALSGSAAYDLVTSGSYTIIGPLYATASWATNAINARTADSASKPYIASNASTNTEYTLVFKNSTGALNDYYQLAADGTNGPYYNPSTNTLTVPVISGSSARITSITGSLSGSVTGNLIGSASYATTASYALTSSYASNGVNSLTYGVYSSTATQPIGANASASIVYDTVEDDGGVSLLNNSQLTVTKTGVYNLQFSAQMKANSGINPNVYIWLRKNGADVPRSNTQINFPGGANDVIVAAWNFVYSLTAGDYLELWWYSTSALPTLQASPLSVSPAFPAIPSVIVTMTQIK